MARFVKIENHVPFGQALYSWFYLKDICLAKLERHIAMEERYLAWESVRKHLNPFFEEGTGFEGYLIGRCLLPEAALEAVLDISQHILDAIARMYRFEYGLRARLMKTLLREDSDPRMIHIWSAYLGAELGRLRAQIIYNDAAQTFQKETYKMTHTLPPIVYHEAGYDIVQTYPVALPNRPQPSKLWITPQMLKPSQQDTWLVAINIGQFGHPLVRRFLDHT